MTENFSKIDAVVGQSLLRARDKKFGILKEENIKNVYFRLANLLGSDLLGNKTRLIKDCIVFDGIPFSGAIFHMQSFLENPNIPLEVKDLIKQIFSGLDPRDLNYRFGECHCVSCVNPQLALAAHIEFTNSSQTVH